MINKGIILAGGTGTRMSPLTNAVNKQLLPIYDKPLIFYPLSILMLSKIKDILIIVNKGQLDQYKKLIPNGKNLGINLSFIEQNSPRGLPEAFILGENFIGKDNVALILGDNFFYGQGLTNVLLKSKKIKICLLFSQQNAKQFLHLIQKEKLSECSKDIKFLTLSPNISSIIKKEGYKKVSNANSPTLKSLLVKLLKIDML